MRLLIFLLALISAFFVSAKTIDMSDLKTPNIEKTETYACAEGTTLVGSGRVESISECSVLVKARSNHQSLDGCSTAFEESFQTDTSLSLKVLRKKLYTPRSGDPYCTIYSTYAVKPSLLDKEETESYICPPTGSEKHTESVMFEGTPMCAKLIDDDEQQPDPDCPAPTDADPFSFAVGGSGSVCFPAADGRQCEIQTDSNGGYNIPVSYGSTEPVSCVPDPEPEPEDPDEPDEPENPDDPEATPDPDAPKTPDDADDTDKDNSLDGINQINDNLKVINDNMNSGIESHAERLDRMAKETQNSNELLATIKSNTLNTYKGTKETTDVIRDQIKETTKVVTAVGTATTEIKKGNTESTKQTTLLEGIKENTKKESISITSSRKKGGLNDIFSADELAQVTAEIETKKTELTDYIETIKSESESILDLDPNISGSYTDHKEIIKGVEVDMGIGRFSNFYKMIAPAIILIASISALFIILGGNKE